MPGIDAQREADEVATPMRNETSSRSNQQSVMLKRSSSRGRAAADLTAGHADHSAHEKPADRRRKR